MSLLHALASGAAGAITLNLIHETARQVLPEAPHVQRVAMRAIAQSMRYLGKTPPDEEELYLLALAGDLASNALYYSMVGFTHPRHPWVHGVALGLAGGLGAVALPGSLGLDSEPVARSAATRAMAVAWYTLGGLAAAAAFEILRQRT